MFNLSDAKEIIQLAKKGMEFQAEVKLMDIREQLLAERDEKLKFKELADELKAKLKLQEELFFDGEVYWKGKDENREGPFCPTCYDKDQKLIRLHRSANGEGWKCRACKGYFGPTVQRSRPARRSIRFVQNY